VLVDGWSLAGRWWRAAWCRVTGDSR
jgi:hypothetical protein